MSPTVRSVSLSALFLTVMSGCFSPPGIPTDDDGLSMGTGETPGFGGSGAGDVTSEGGAGGAGAEGGEGGGLPEAVTIALPFEEDFESYGLSSVAPFGPWIGDSTGTIHVTLDRQGSETQVADANGLVLPGTFEDFRFETDIVTNCTYCSVHIQLRSNTVGQYGYELVVGTNYNQLDFALWKEKEGYTKQLAAPESWGGWGPDQWAHVRVDIAGGHIQVYFEDELIADVTDDDKPVLSGGVGLWGRFDNVTLSPLAAAE